MLIQKNVKTTFRLNAGRDRSSVNGWAAEYQILDKAGAVIFPVGGGYSAQDIEEIGNGLYGVAITFVTTYCGFLRWKISAGATDLYSVDAFTIVKTYGNAGVEQTYLANFGKSRIGKSCDYRILADDLTEFRAWSNIGIFELGSGLYGVATAITGPMSGYIEWRNNTDGLYVSDPINIFTPAPVFEHAAPAISIIDANIFLSVNRLDAVTITDNQVNTQIIDESKIDVSISRGINIGVSI